LKNSTYKWIIGCLLGVIIVLITYLVLRENNMISVSFSECLSVASTISSLILSVIAMLYTYYSGRDTGNISAQIQNTIKAVDRQVQNVSEDTRKNSETLAKIIEGTQTILNAVNSSSEAFQTIQEEHISEQERQNAMETIEKSKNSMLMFLKKMQENT
jgi:predicted PurR-regulated permease PerM